MASGRGQKGGKDVAQTIGMRRCESIHVAKNDLFSKA